MKLLLERAPDEGVAVVNRLSGLPEETRFSHPESLTISTQVIVDEGRPDIEIREGQERLLYVEVKHDSPLGVRQLERYLTELRGSGLPNTRLVLLTRSRVSARETTEEARELEEMGYSRVLHYAGGKQDWIRAGLPVEGKRYRAGA